MRVFQARNDARLLLEARGEFLAFRKLARQDLDCDIPIDRGLLGCIDSRHASPANLSNDAIVAEHLSGLKNIHVALQVV